MQAVNGRNRESETAFVFMANGVWLVWMWHCAWGVWRRVITSTEEAGESLCLNSVHLFWSLLPIIMTKSLPQGNIWYLMWTCQTHLQNWFSFVLNCILLLFLSVFCKFVLQIAFLKQLIRSEHISIHEIIIQWHAQYLPIYTRILLHVLERN